MAPERIAQHDRAARQQALGRLFSFELWRRLGEVENGLEANRWAVATDAHCESVERVLETVAESAPALGLDEVAAATGRFLGQLREPRSGDSPAGKENLRQAFGELLSAAARADRLEDLSPATIEGEPSARVRRFLLLFEETSRGGSDLSFQLGCFGFVVRRAADAEDLRQSLPHAAAVIMNVDLESPTAAGAAALDALRACRNGVLDPPPFLLLSSRNDLRTRVRAVRAGADAFFPLPANVRDLVERLDLLAHQHAEVPYRVLLLEEDYPTALGLTLQLQDSGLEVTHVDAATRALAAVEEISPDVVLTDLELHDLSGVELAAVLRQQREHADLPIVYLSREPLGLDRHLRALGRAGDDLITLPSTPEQLLPTVFHHAARYRLLRYYRTRDALTGLLNFSSGMDLLRRECARATREDCSLTLALLDIDSLDDFNRAAGHLGGDSVLRSLASLLCQRFRRSDGLCRFGNRFLVLMPGTTMSNALQVLQEARLLFAEVHRRDGDPSSTVTLSGGLASYRRGDRPRILYRTARRALDRARALGGDRLETIDD